MPAVPRTLLVAGERRRALVVDDASDVPERSDVALAYGLLSEPPPGWASLGASLVLERPLRLAGALPIPVLLGGQPKKGFRAITVNDPRFSRMWGRFSVDVRAAIERDEKFIGPRVFDRAEERGYRVFIMEDGDRYAIRAVVVFTLKDSVGYVLELLHDRTVDGMKNAVELLGHALHTMRAEGAHVARALSLPHAGAAPMLRLHGFTRARHDRRELVVRALDPSVEAVVYDPELWYASYLDLDDV